MLYYLEEPIANLDITRARARATFFPRPLTRSLTRENGCDRGADNLNYVKCREMLQSSWMTGKLVRDVRLQNTEIPS